MVFCPDDAADGAVGDAASAGIEPNPTPSAQALAINAFLMDIIGRSPIERHAPKPPAVTDVVSDAEPGRSMEDNARPSGRVAERHDIDSVARDRDA